MFSAMPSLKFISHFGTTTFINVMPTSLLTRSVASLNRSLSSNGAFLHKQVPSNAKTLGMVPSLFAHHPQKRARLSLQNRDHKIQMSGMEPIPICTVYNEKLFHCRIHRSTTSYMIHTLRTICSSFHLLPIGR